MSVYRNEPALRHGLIVGLIAAGLGWLGLELSASDRAALDGLIVAVAVALPVLQGIVQALLTRRRVMPTATIEAAGLSPRAIRTRADQVEDAG